MSDAPENLTALQKIAAAQAAPVARFNTELVRSAFEAVQRRRREARRAAMRSHRDFGEDEPALDPDFERDPLTYGWIRQMWTDHIIVTHGGEDQGKAIRIPYTVEPPGTDPEHVKFGEPELLRVAYVAATDSLSRVAGAAETLELAKRVRTQAGVQRWKKPIGTLLGDGTTGKVASATGKDANPRADSLRKNIKELAAKDKTYRGGKVFGDIGNEGKLKNALSAITNLPDGKRGEAAAEIVLAAQALGLTRLVPSSIKRLYRAYLAQKPADKKPADKKPASKSEKS